MGYQVRLGMHCSESDSNPSTIKTNESDLGMRPRWVNQCNKGLSNN